MTEQEKTELALASAKRAQEKIDRQTQKATKATKVTPKKETKTELQPNQVKIAEDIVITLSPWTGKTKKKFKREFKFADSMEDVDIQKILSILVYDSVKEDVLFSDHELQYLLAKLNILSISDKFSKELDCPNCGVSNKINTTISENIEFKMNKMPAKFKDYEFKNTKKSIYDEYLEKIEEDEDLTTPKDVELACKISKDNKSPEEMLELFDETPINELSELMDEFIKVQSDFKLVNKHKCRSCEKEQDFELEIITGIFETLAE